MQILDLERDGASKTSSKEDEASAPGAAAAAAAPSGRAASKESSKESSKLSAEAPRVQRQASDKLLHRLLSFVFQSVMKDSELDRFFERNKALFAPVPGRDGVADGADEEFRVEWTPCFDEYRRLMETKLDAFATLEKLDSAQELRDIVADAVASKRANKRYLSMILAATDDFKRFVGMMRAKERGAGSSAFAEGAALMRKKKKKAAAR